MAHAVCSKQLAETQGKRHAYYTPILPKPSQSRLKPGSNIKHHQNMVMCLIYLGELLGAPPTWLPMKISFIYLNLVIYIMYPLVI